MAAADPTIILGIGLLAMLVVIVFAIVRLRSLFAIVMLQGVYSLVSAAWFVTLDAVDVAFTEAAVGAGISTVLMLSAMLLADRQAKPMKAARRLGPLLVVTIAGLAMFFAIGDMPAFGDANSPANTGVGMAYLEATRTQIEVPNVVTAVLASYRGYDTFGEVIVIFMAGLGILLLLGLNGNAGKWEAKPNGQNIGTPGPTLSRDEEVPLPVKAPAKRPAKKTKARKAPTAKKPAIKKAPAKKPAARKKPAKPAAKKGGAS